MEHKHLVRVWDAASAAQRRVLRGHGDWVTSVALSADGTTIVSGSDDETVRVCVAASGAQRRALRHEARVHSVALSADGTTIASGSWDDTVRVWDAASGECREVIHGTGAREADVEAIAAWPSRFPFCALRRGLETVIEDAATATPVAWFPCPSMTSRPSPTVAPGSGRARITCTSSRWKAGKTGQRTGC